MHLVLPGVGSFEAGIKALKMKNWPEGIYEHVELKKPLLGICLGMQLLFTRGEEYGIYDGLGLIKGVVKKMVKLLQHILIVKLKIIIKNMQITIPGTQ